MTPARDLEFFETPQAFTRYLFLELASLGHPIAGTVYEPCVGSGAILRAQATVRDLLQPPAAVTRWVTNDLDPRWNADSYEDARTRAAWRHQLDWTVSNPPFTPALDITALALEHSLVGVAMHLRASIHEVLKTGIRRTWMAQHPPTGLLWLPRFAYQRSKATGKWSTDSVCACWVIWLQDPAVPQFIRYAPEWVLHELDRETPVYRESMDQLMGYHGSEGHRQAQRKAA
jgi:hypothetical protein